MTEQEARNILHSLRENREIPDEFNEHHSDYERAVKFVMDNQYFDFEKFNNNISIIEFGIWRVEHDSLVATGHDYVIERSRLWETQEYSGFLVWDWLIHLTKKSWIKIENINDLNTAFFFCQDYFKKFKPKRVPYVSTAQTLNIQKQIMEIRDEMDSQIEIDRNGIVSIDAENILKFIDLRNNIKFI